MLLREKHSICRSYKTKFYQKHVPGLIICQMPFAVTNNKNNTVSETSDAVIFHLNVTQKTLSYSRRMHSLILNCQIIMCIQPFTALHVVYCRLIMLGIEFYCI